MTVFTSEKRPPCGHLAASPSTVQRMAREGMLLKGSFTNAASEMQDSAAAMGKKGSVSSTAQQISEAAESWAKKNNTELEVTLDACAVAQCGQFGLSVDFGARLVPWLLFYPRTQLTLMANSTFSNELLLAKEHFRLPCSLSVALLRNRSLLSKKDGARFCWFCCSGGNCKLFWVLKGFQKL